MPPRVDAAEFARLASLYRCGMLDSVADPAFDRVVDRVAATLDVPIVQLVFADTHRFWAKSSRGPVESEAPRGRGILDRLIGGGPGVMTADDAATVEAALPHGAVELRSFAGARIASPEGEALGVLYGADLQARAFDDAAVRVLEDAVAEIQGLLTGHRIAREDEDTGALRRDAFLDQASRLLGVSCLGRKWVSLVTLDLAPFLSALDVCGTGLRSLVLRSMTELGRTQLRQRDCFGRLGPDLFAVLLTETAEAGAEVLIQRLSQYLATGWAAAGLGSIDPVIGRASLKPAGIAGELDALLEKAGLVLPTREAIPLPRVA